jgi:NADH:ubiquinone oxidoreductase subunit 6 (subunit J)
VSAARILTVYRVIFSALIVVASVQTLRAAHADHGILLLAGSEIAGALILCWRRTQWLGALLLLVVFAAAQVTSAMQGEWPMRFLLYAASALLIVTMDRTLARSH